MQYGLRTKHKCSTRTNAARKQMQQTLVAPYTNATISNNHYVHCKIYIYKRIYTHKLACAALHVISCYLAWSCYVASHKEHINTITHPLPTQH